MNQRAPSGPAVMYVGELPEGIANGVTVPLGVIRLIWLSESSSNQRLPSDPSVMIRGDPPTGNSLVTTPAVVIRPTLPAPFSVK